MRLLPLLTVGLALLSANATSASAQSTDADFAALSKAGKRGEIETMARDRLSKSASDDVALWYLARVTAGDEKKREEVMKRAEDCVAARPKSSRCHSALGNLYGAMAMAGGMTGGLKYAGKVKDAMQAAVDNEPKNFDLRRDLIQYYLQAPGIVGGSVRKATENAEMFEKIDALRGAILRAEVLAYDKKFERAEGILLGLKADAGSETDDTLFSAKASLGFAMINGDHAARAQKLFERLSAERPSNATAQFGIGRALLEQKNVDGAIAAIEKALQLDPKLAAHYRLGIAYQAKGNKPKAIAAFEHFLTYQSAGRIADDTRKRLEELKRG